MNSHGLPGYGNLPAPLLIAREDEALTHGQVMYGLIKPTKDMEMVESTAAMVNVIPKKRIYRMENPEEIDLFMAELMKRPLVIQPSAYIGRGLSVIGCTLYTKEERWVLLINQAHPKIQSRVQLGIEAAKAKMHRGEPFILEISFNAFLKRVYLSRLTKAALDQRFTIIDFEDAEIVIRYPGDRYHRGMQWELKGDNKIRFEFEDLLPGDIVRRTVSGATTEWNNPALRVIMPDELMTMLPGWGFENKDPFEGIEPPSADEEQTDDEEGAVGGRYDPPGYDEAQAAQAPAPASNRVVGRAQRKANKPTTLEVPIELHDIKTKPRNVSPGSSSAKTPSPNYEKLNRTPDEHPYSHSRFGPPGSPGMNQHSPSSVYPAINQQKSSYSGPSPRTPTTPRTPVSPAHNGQPRNMEMPPSADRYNEAVRSTPKTYLTDDDGGFSSQSARSPRLTPNMKYDAGDDGGFASHSPRSPRLPVNRQYDTNSNEKVIDRYGNQVPSQHGYNPRDRYADHPVSPRNVNLSDRPRDLYVDNQSTPQGSSRPVPAARGFHRYQGSGRSDTSTSDSGFGETDYGHDPSGNRHNGYGGMAVKTPYYNHAYEQDSPEAVKTSVVDDILAKHKALAEKMMSQQNTGQEYNRQDMYNDSNYTRQLQHWRQNINDLEESCDQPDVNFSRSRLRVNSQGEPMEESFI
ncbi:hypothetical protein ACF0H5_018610 [Mactra antiquata]